MHTNSRWLMITCASSLLAVTGAALSAQDRYSVAVPNGLAFSEFRGYDRWEIVGLSHNGDKLAVIVANPIMIDAYKAGIPDNGKPFPDGAKMAKIHWMGKVDEGAPGQPVVTGDFHDVDFMAKDAKRFADSGGWGYAAFQYESASDSFRPSNSEDQPPQEHDAKCGYSCHTIVEKKDYVFTAYARR